jgi:hypothetical protein
MSFSLRPLRKNQLRHLSSPPTCPAMLSAIRQSAQRSVRTYATSSATVSARG